MSNGGLRVRVMAGHRAFVAQRAVCRVVEPACRTPALRARRIAASPNAAKPGSRTQARGHCRWTPGRPQCLPSRSVSAGRVEGAGPSRAALERFPPPRRPADARCRAVSPVSERVYAHGRTPLPEGRVAVRVDGRGRLDLRSVTSGRAPDLIRTALVTSTSQPSKTRWQPPGSDRPQHVTQGCVDRSETGCRKPDAVGGR
jgi:hypothetical protein